MKYVTNPLLGLLRTGEISEYKMKKEKKKRRNFRVECFTAGGIRREGSRLLRGRESAAMCELREKFWRSQGREVISTRHELT